MIYNKRPLYLWIWAEKDAELAGRIAPPWFT